LENPEYEKRGGQNTKKLESSFISVLKEETTLIFFQGDTGTCGDG
jgi:hypothetical protein